MSSAIIYPLCPYPHIAGDGEMRDGCRVNQPRVCRKCDDKECRELQPGNPTLTVEHHCCSRGMSVYLIDIGKEILRINGVIDATENTACPPRRRKENRTQKVTKEGIERFRRRALECVESIESTKRAVRDEIIAPFHGVKSACNSVLRNAEAAIEGSAGTDFNQQYENAPPKIRNLFKSVNLLQEHIAFASLAINPESLSYGKKYKCEVYKIFDKYAHIFEEAAGEKGITIVRRGKTDAAIRAYGSIGTLVLVLVDNAVKYSVRNGEIHLIFSDKSSCLAVEVSSMGPIVPPENRERIFEKGYRDPSAKEYCAEGYGLGLYFARMIAEHHGFSLSYVPSPLGKPDFGLNVFRLEIPETDILRNEYPSV